MLNKEFLLGGGRRGIIDADVDDINSFQRWLKILFFTEDDVGKSIPIWTSRDPSPMVKRHQGHNLRSRNRVLCRRRSLGGAKC